MKEEVRRLTIQFAELLYLNWLPLPEFRGGGRLGVMGNEEIG